MPSSKSKSHRDHHPDKRSKADKKAQDSSTLNGYLYDCSSVQERLARDTKEDRYARDKKQVDKFEKRFEGKQ